MNQPKSTYFATLRHAQGDSSCHGEPVEPPFDKLRVTVDCPFLTGKAAGVLVMVSVSNHDEENVLFVGHPSTRSG